MTLESHIENIIIGACFWFWLFVIFSLIKLVVIKIREKKYKKETRMRVEKVKRLMRDPNNKIDFSRALNLADMTIHGIATMELLMEKKKQIDSFYKNKENGGK